MKKIGEKEEGVTTLKVAEAKPRDAGRGLVRLDPQVASTLGLSSGDVLEIEGKKRTVALCWPGYPEDAGAKNIRMDGSLRRNAQTSIDEKVKVRKVVAKNAEKVVFAPTEPLKIMAARNIFPMCSRAGWSPGAIPSSSTSWAGSWSSSS